MLHYQGQIYELEVPVPAPRIDRAALDALAESFGREHERTYGHRAESDPVEVVALRLRASLPAPDLPLPQAVASGDKGRTRSAYFGASHGWIDTPVLGRGDLLSEPAEGPLIVEDYDSTTLVPPDATGCLDAWGNIVMEMA
jgi:N-methylhydantoinase A